MDSLHLDPIAPILFWVTSIFLLAMLGRYAARYMHQPGVLGELVIGVLFGNLCYLSDCQMIHVLRQGPSVYDLMHGVLQGNSLWATLTQSSLSPSTIQSLYAALTSVNGTDYLKVSYILDVFSRYGVIFLLFLVGVESSLQELTKTGKAAMRVAVLGVVLPFLFGFVLSKWMMPHLGTIPDLFIGATLCATSVGVTAQVLREFNALRTQEARTILGAAMLDDILGLLILAVITNLIQTGQFDWLQLIRVCTESLLFFCATLTLGPWLLNRAFFTLRFFSPTESKLITIFLMLMILSWLATLIHLSAIIGAFCAGLMIRDEHFAAHSKPIKELVAPLESIFAPLFFVLIGIQVKLETVFDKQVVFMSIGLILVAILGKLLSGLVASRSSDKVLIGIGMVPRGEVGLIFASIGKSAKVLSDELFSAIVLMVLVTTLVTPLLLKWRLKPTSTQPNPT